VTSAVTTSPTSTDRMSVSLISTQASWHVTPTHGGWNRHPAGSGGQVVVVVPVVVVPVPVVDVVDEVTGTQVVVVVPVVLVVLLVELVDDEVPVVLVPVVELPVVVVLLVVWRTILPG